MCAILGQAEIFTVYEVLVFRFNNTDDLVMLTVSWYNGVGNILMVNGILLYCEEEVQVTVKLTLPYLSPPVGSKSKLEGKTSK